MGIFVRERRRKYRSALKDLVASQPAPASRPLPLTHVTDSIRLQIILDRGELAPRPCRIFGDPRLYAFYARPAYRGNKQGPLHNLNFAPVCFIIDASVTERCHPVEVFPFDTGALSAGVLAEDVHEDLSPFDFALDPKVESAQQLIRTFFSDDKTYYSGHYRPLNGNTHGPTDAEIVAYESLVRRGGNRNCDERGTSVEFQFNKPLPLDGKILAIILPQDFLDDKEMRRSIKEKKITPLPYIFIPDHSVSEFVGVFYTLAADFYTRKCKHYDWQW